MKSFLQRVTLLSLFLTIFYSSQCLQLAPSSLTLPQDPDVLTAFNTTSLLWPLPQKLTLNQSGPQLLVDPCTINYKISATPSDYIKQIINIYLIQVFHCTVIKPGNLSLTIIVKFPNQFIAEQPIHEKYSITIRERQILEWDIVADYYVGFLRGFQTFTQLFQFNKNGKRVIHHAPIQIDDIPQFVWRGLMLDTSRHFIPVSQIKHQIDAMFYNKMSILHWHISDDDSFPMTIVSEPEFSQAGKLGGSYSPSEIKSVINYAKIRGVRVVPEINTPAHTQSWGRAPKYNGAVVNCSNMWTGQLDPTLPITYTLLNNVMKQLNDAFQDNYVHFGGDIISGKCYDLKPSIKKWMDEQKIANYSKLQSYYRGEQKKNWRNISKTKKVIYWINQSSEIPTQTDEVLQWYGSSQNVSQLANKANQVILSNYNQTFLDFGFGKIDGVQQTDYIDWKKISQYNPIVKGVKVIGGEACLSSWFNNQHTLDPKIWPRASMLNQRLWNSNLTVTKNIGNVVDRFITHHRRLKERGINVGAFAPGLCERNSTICRNQY